MGGEGLGVCFCSVWFVDGVCEWGGVANIVFLRVFMLCFHSTVYNVYIAYIQYICVAEQSMDQIKGEHLPNVFSEMIKNEMLMKKMFSKSCITKKRKSAV